MRKVYDASNALEAHMLVDLLKQQGIAGRIDGEYLQGAVGEVPAAGLVRVMVDEDHYDEARRVVERWDADQPAPAAGAPAAPARARAGRSLFFAAGLLAGVACAAAWFHVPASTDGIDHNRDGTLDERWIYSPGGRLLRIELDRNLDGQVDHVTVMDERGAPKDAAADDDFDGRFESRFRFRDGNVDTSDVVQADGRVLRRSFHVSGVVVSTEYLDPASGRVRKVEHYRGGQVTHAEIDTDGDGALDRRVRYDAIGEVVASERMP
jgi:hypothetical protein